MNREYKFAAYALALAAVLFAVSGAIVVSGVGPGGGTGDPASDGEPTRTANETTGLDQYDVSVASSSNETLTFTSATPSCSGPSLVGASEPDRTETRLGDTTVTLIADDDAPFDELDRQQFAALVRDAVSNRTSLDEYAHLEMRVTQYYESLDREQPRDVAGVTVRPREQCLPYASGDVDLDDETVTIRRTLSPVESLELAFTDAIGVLDDDEKELIEDLVAADGQASYNVQRQFDESQTLDATVLEATNDGRIDLELTRPDRDGSAVRVTVNLDEETVVRSSTVLELEKSDIASNDSETGTVEFSVESNASDGEP